MEHTRLSIAEIFGLTPLRTRLREAALAFAGDASTPKTRYDRSSLAQLFRIPGWRYWAGQKPFGRRVAISNLFNHTPTPLEDGWSVRVTQVRDFMGGGLTYDSHNATDFAIPIGTTVVAAAPGVVRRVSNEFNRGGLKVFIDHGDGLITTSNHLGRALVSVGERVRRGQPIALSGYSGLDGVATFPWGIPHVHYNVWLNGSYVDPFAPPGGVALWRTGNWPVPYPGDAAEAAAEILPPTEYDEAAMARALFSCRSADSRAEIESYGDLHERAFALMFHMNIYPMRFGERPSIYRQVHQRSPRLDLPFSAEEYDGVHFPGMAPPA